MHTRRLLVAFLLSMLPFSQQAKAQSLNLSEDYYYGSINNTRNIARYDLDGTYLDFTTAQFTGGQLRGLAFSPDGKFYAVTAPPTSSTIGVSVLVLSNTGRAVRSYNFTGARLTGNASLGKIAFDLNGNFYVGTMQGLLRFQTSDTRSGNLVWQGNRIFDVVALPNNHLLICDDYAIHEVDSDGNLVGDFLSPDIGFTDLRGLEFDPATHSLYVTMLGDSGTGFFDLMRFDWTTHNLLNHTHFTYGDDMVFTNDNRLLVGSRNQSPGLFSNTLRPLGTLSGPSVGFVTQLRIPTDAVPEPGILALLVSGMFVGRSVMLKRSQSRSLKKMP